MDWLMGHFRGLNGNEGGPRLVHMRLVPVQKVWGQN